MVSSKNKREQAKRKNIIKKQRLNRKKCYKETESSVTGSRTWFICMCKQLLDHYATMPYMFWLINFVISKPFFSAIDAVWSWWSCLYHEFKYTFEQLINLSAYFKAISHFFGLNGPVDVDNRSNYVALLNLVEN